MPTTQSILLLALLLLFLLAVWGIIAAGLGYVAGTFASRWNAGWFAAGVRLAIALVTVALGMLGALIVVAPFANAETAAKATILAKGILELITCTPFAAPIAALTIAIGFWLPWRLIRRSRDPRAHV